LRGQNACKCQCSLTLRKTDSRSSSTLCHEVPNFLSYFMTCLSSSGEMSCFVVSLYNLPD